MKPVNQPAMNAHRKMRLKNYKVNIVVDKEQFIMKGYGNKEIMKENMKISSNISNK